MESETTMSLPLDSDGFLRRECPTCEREFKWLHTENPIGVPPQQGGYHCPYCSIQAPPDHFLTQAQVELATNIIARDVLAPEVDRLGRSMRSRRRSTDLITMDVRMDKPTPLDPLVEVDDMVRVDFTCHATEPVKVLETWDREVHCLVCGMGAAGGR